MVREPINVLRDDEMDPLVSTLDIADLKNLCVITEHIRRHLEGRNVDYINVRVLGSKYATDLSVLALQELVH